MYIRYINTSIETKQTETQREKVILKMNRIRTDLRKRGGRHKRLLKKRLKFFQILRKLSSQIQETQWFLSKINIKEIHIKAYSNKISKKQGITQ